MLLAGAVLVPHLMEMSIRRKVARAKADLRTISGGLGSYGIEAPQALPALKAAADAVRVKNDLRALTAGLDLYFIDRGMIPPSIVKPGSPALPPTFVANCLTTPVAYLNGMNFSDPYAPAPNMPYRYYASENGKDWILWSAGPDGAYNLTDSNLPAVFNYGGAPSAGLVNLSYDPTNGATSRGDIWISNEGYGN